MVNCYIYVWDCSISLMHSDHCRTDGLNTFEQFKRDEENIKKEQLVAGEPPTGSRCLFVHWSEDYSGIRGDESIPEYFDLIRKWAERKPEWIIRCLKDDCMVKKDDKIKLLYIVTDGRIGIKSVKECIELNKDFNYETVVFHALSENLERIDLTVAAPFFKSRCVAYRNYELCHSIDISKNFDYDKINSDNFAAEKNQLQSYIKLKFINKFRLDAGALQEINKLTKLRDRLYNELILKRLIYTSRGAFSKAIARISPMPVTDCAEIWNFFNTFYKTSDEVEKFFAALLEYIQSNEKCYSFDALKCDTIDDKPVADEQMNNADS